MFGFPDDNMETMQETLNLAKELKCEHTNFYSMMPYPNSEVRNYAIEKGWDLPETWSGYAQYSYDCFPLRTNYLSNREVLEFRDRAFQEYFTDPDYLAMIEEIFGRDAVKDIQKITSAKLKRKLLDDKLLHTCGQPTT